MMPHPRPYNEQRLEAGVKYVCDNALFADIHQSLREEGRRPYVIQIDNNEIIFRVIDLEYAHG